MPGLDTLGVPPDGGGLYEVALTHRSYAFEHGLAAHNERLEFLGDAILDALVTDHIYNTYPAQTEGDLARLRASVVNTGALAGIARSVSLGDHLLLGKGEEATGGRDKSALLADCFEAVVGALYLDRGYEAVRQHILPLLVERITRVMATGGPNDAKTTLQELAVKQTGSPPVYEIRSSGPDHEKTFKATVLVGERIAGSGEGRSKKEAEQRAAAAAIDLLASDDKETARAGAS